MEDRLHGEIRLLCPCAQQPGDFSLVSVALADITGVMVQHPATHGEPLPGLQTHSKGAAARLELPLRTVWHVNMTVVPEHGLKRN